VHRSVVLFIIVSAGVAAGVSAGRTAAAQTVYELDGAVNVGYTSTSTPTPTTDPTEPQSQTSNRFFTDLRPGFAIQTGSPRVAWRLGYVFAGSLSLDGSGPNTYSNQATAALAAQLSNRSSMTLSTSVTQGGTAFQLSQQAADAGQPGLRAPGSPDLVAATVGEAFAWEASEHVRFGQSITGTLSAPQDDLGQFSATMTGSLSLDRVFPTDAIGGEFRSSVALLRPLTAEGDPYWSITNVFLGRWNHDFSVSWNGSVTAGVSQVVTLAGSYPLAIVPTGTLSARYTSGNAVGSLILTHGTATNVQTGTVSMRDQVVVRGAVSFDPLLARALRISAGFSHDQALGEASALVAAGTGNAVQGDVGLAWGLNESLLATARYSVAYQFGQSGGLQPQLTQVLLVGVTGRYSNARRPPALPTLGQRVDGSDAVGFPGSITQP
jgi:hypothetical protein